MASPLEGRILAERYQLLEELGSGGIGVVFRALDRRRGLEVAIKALHRVDEPRVESLKREFRVLADLVHPNVVTLHELGWDGERWFIVMELVEGDPFTDWVSRPIPDPSGARPNAGRLVRLRHALRGLSEGLDHLHASSRIHGDVKPANVLVTTEGRVVILDLGLSAKLDVTNGLVAGRGRAVSLGGTLAYMPPEQLSGATIGPSADWYAVGVMVFEALTGRAPFEGDLASVARQRLEAPRARSLAPDVPPDLDEVCAGLLERDPRERLDGRAIRERLVPNDPRANRPPAPLPARAATSFVGRRRELARLADAHDAAAQADVVAVLIRGKAGIGKTALVRAFLQGLRDRPRLAPSILEGRSYEQSSVPFKALDGVLDRVASLLARLPVEERAASLPPGSAGLLRLFPGLAHVMPEQPVPSDLPAEPWELRRAAFGALRQILFGLGKTGPLVIFLDDLHWADLDSAVFLGQLLRSASPRGLLLVGCFRSDSIQASPFLRRWSEMRAELHGHVLFDDLELGELDEPESRALARDLLPDPSGPEADGVCERIAAESRGHPIFLAQLARHAATSGTAASLTLEAAVQARLAQLPEPARRLLVTLSAAGHPLAVELAQEAADLPAQERTALAALRGAGLVQPAASGAPGWIEPVHDVIREQALAGISADDRATVHRALARSLRGQGTEAAEDVAHHLIEAGDHRDAAVFVREAAVGAARQLAFERAAELYGLAIELGRDPGDLAALLEGLAEAHLGAGHTQPAGVAFERASVALAALDPADTHDLLRLEQRAAEAFLRGGFIEDGMRLLRLAFARAGVRWPVSERASIASIVASTARLALRPRYSPRGPSRAGGRWQLEADVCFTAWLGTLWCDTLRSLDFQHRYLLYALRSGDPVRTARALVIQAHGIGLLGSKRARRRADTMIRGIRDFVFEVGDPYVDFYWEFGQGSYAIYAGDWAHALRSLEKAHGLGRALGGVAWEQTLIGCYRLWALAYLGDIPRLMAQRAELVEQAAESGELWTSAIGDLAMSVFGALADDDPSGARARTEDALRRLPSTRYQSAHYGAFVCQAWVDLYVGAPDAALARAGAEVTNLKRTRTWDIQRMRTETRLIEGLAELGLARDARDAATRARHLTRSTALARALRRERVPWIDGLAQLLFGLGADLAGEPDLALASLSAAHRRFTERDMHLYAAVTGLRLGARLGGDEGARMTAYSRRWLGGRGVVAIDRLADAMAPARAG